MLDSATHPYVVRDAQDKHVARFASLECAARTVRSRGYRFRKHYCELETTGEKWDYGFCDRLVIHLESRPSYIQ